MLRHLLRRRFNPETIVEMSEHIYAFFGFFLRLHGRAGGTAVTTSCLVFAKLESLHAVAP